MTETEQIQEMAKVLEFACENRDCAKPINCDLCQAKQLYSKGYRKVERGEWIPKDNFDGRCSIATCSKCGTEKAFSVLVSVETIESLYPFCQKCGADMRKEDEGK